MLRLVSGLQSLGHDVVVASASFDPSGDLLRRFAGVEWRHLKRGPRAQHPQSRRDRLRLFWREMAKVAGLLHDVDIVNAHEWPALHAGAVAARTRRVPFVWTRNDPTLFEMQYGVETFASSDTRAGVRRQLRRAIHAGDYRDARTARVVSVLDSTSAAIVQRVYRRRAEIVRSGPAPHFFDAPSRPDARARLGVPLDSTLLLCVGIMFRHRSFEDVIDAVKLLRRDFPAEVWILGSDAHVSAYADELEGYIEGARMKTAVRLMRKGVSDAELVDLYAAADVFVHTPAWQTYGLAPLEALACGTPIVLSTGAGVHEILDGRPGVRTVRPRDPAAIAAAVKETLAGASDLDATRSWIRSHLNDERFASSMLRLFDVEPARSE